MLGGIGVGAAQQKDVAGEFRAAGEHLLAVDHPIIAISHRAGAGAEHIRTRARLAVAQAAGGLAARQLGQHLGLGFGVAKPPDHMAHHVGNARAHAAPAVAFPHIARAGVGIGIGAAPAVFLGPRGEQQPGRAELLVEIPVMPLEGEMRLGLQFGG